MKKAVQITLIIMIAIGVVFGFLAVAWINSPTEFLLNLKVENETLVVMDKFITFMEDYENRTSFEEVVNNTLEGLSGGNK